MQYNANIETLEDFYTSIYAIPSRKTRAPHTPKSVTKKLLDALDNPQKKLRSVLITGSKGKGSSAIMLANLLQNSGKRVGLFSSPHLFDFRERIVINGAMIDQRGLLLFARRVFAAANALDIEHPDEFPRFFEVTTAIAYLYFAERGVDYAVIETGIGALTDATNQDSHCLSVLTNIEAEHLDIFGDIEGVATEKSGVMLSGVPLILGDLAESVDQLIIDAAADLAVPVTRFKSSYLPNNKGFFQVKVGKLVWITDSKLKAQNAWVALAAMKQLGVHCEDELLLEALQHTRLPAREEIVSRVPFVIIDGAHSGESAKNLAYYVAKATDAIPPRKKVMLVSFSAVKNIAPVMSAFPDVQKIVITQATETRSLNTKVIEKHLLKLDSFTQAPKIKHIENPLTALEKTLKKLKEDDVLIVTGSVYLAGLLSQQFRL